MSQEATRPTKETREAERAEALVEATADRAPTADEEHDAERHTVDPDVAEHEREMAERGADQKGEGRVP